MRTVDTHEPASISIKGKCNEQQYKNLTIRTSGMASESWMDAASIHKVKLKQVVTIICSNFSSPLRSQFRAFDHLCNFSERERSRHEWRQKKSGLYQPNRRYHSCFCRHEICALFVCGKFPFRNSPQHATCVLSSLLLVQRFLLFINSPLNCNCGLFIYAICSLLGV